MSEIYPHLPAFVRIFKTPNLHELNTTDFLAASAREDLVCPMSEGKIVLMDVSEKMPTYEAVVAESLGEDVAEVFRNLDALVIFPAGFPNLPEPFDGTEWGSTSAVELIWHLQTTGVSQPFNVVIWLENAFVFIPYTEMITRSEEFMHMVSAFQPREKAEEQRDEEPELLHSFTNEQVDRMNEILGDNPHIRAARAEGGTRMHLLLIELEDSIAESDAESYLGLIKDVLKTSLQIPGLVCRRPHDLIEEGSALTSKVILYARDQEPPNRNSGLEFP